ncbi:MAG: hypothetical protein V1904_01135 [Bacteroidota bacterium]
MSDFLKISYSNSCDIGGSVFTDPSNAFAYTIFLPVNIGEGAYEFKEEGREDGEGNFIRDFGRLQRDYTFELVIPEYTYDSLCHVMIHDTVKITTKYDENSRVFNFKVGSPEWLQKGGVCKVQVSFTVNYIITSGCCQENKLTYQPCLSCIQDVYTDSFEIIDWIAVNDPIIVDHLPTVVDDGDIYMVGVLVGGVLTNNQLYVWSTGYPYNGSWHIFPGQTFGEGSLAWGVCFTKDGIDYYFYFDGVSWQPYKVFKSVVNSGVTIICKCYCLPDTWAHLKISADGGATYNYYGALTSKTEAEATGIIVTGLTIGVSYKFKFELLNNNCNYGYSSVVTIVKA